jgi:hypothetical protein
VIGLVAACTAVAVGVVGEGRVGGEFGEQALPVALADAGGSGEGGAGRGLAGSQLRLVGRQDSGAGAGWCALTRRCRLVCGVLTGLRRCAGSGLA